jgi:hypothetical protein
VRPDCTQRQAALLVAGEKPGACPGVGPARVRVADIGGEELDVAPTCLVTEIGDQGRHYVGVGRRRRLERAGFDDGGELVGWGCHGPFPSTDLAYDKDVIIHKIARGGQGGLSRFDILQNVT